MVLQVILHKTPLILPYFTLRTIVGRMHLPVHREIRPRKAMELPNVTQPKRYWEEEGLRMCLSGALGRVCSGKDHSVNSRRGVNREAALGLKPCWGAVCLTRGGARG